MPASSQLPSRYPEPAPRGLASAFHVRIPEVWVRLLIALIGLVLAFAAALFSTVSRQSGNLWATLILASVALVLAIVVGLTTVPYLAHRVALERFRDAFHYDVTRVGIFYVVAVVLIAIAALNTGNNLLYIIVSAMLGAVLVSGIASALVLRDLELEVRLPEHVFSGQPALGKIILRNPRRILPSFSVSFVPVGAKKGVPRWSWERTTFAFPPNRPAGKQWFRLGDRVLRRVTQSDALPGIFSGSVYFPHIPAGGSLTADLELQFTRRGRYQEKAFGLATRFPFAFLTKTRHVSLLRELLVYPSVEATDEFFEVLPLISGEFETFVRGRGDDLYRIREYLPEDSARHVDWKATAKSGSLKVREFSREDERRLRIVFDNPARGRVSEKIYEGAVALAASLGWHFASENTQISFVAQGHKQDGDVYRFLAYLATVEAGDGPSLVDQIAPSGDYNIILTTRPHGTIPTALWACSYFVFLGAETAAARK